MHRLLTTANSQKSRRAAESTAAWTFVSYPGSARPQPAEARAVICRHPDCGKQFSAPTELRKHLRTHTGERPFACWHENCDKAFRQKSTLGRHLRVHNGAKLFVCPYEGCTRAFFRNDVLQTHQLCHTRELPLACPHPGCTDRFRSLFARKQHLRQHDHQAKREGRHTDRPFACAYPDCGKRFVQGSHLRSHSHIHSGEKNFLCPWPACGWRFAENSNLTKHLRTHSSDRPYCCPQEGCGKSFRRRAHLRAHGAVHLRKAAGQGPVGEPGQSTGTRTQVRALAVAEPARFWPASPDSPSPWASSAADLDALFDSRLVPVADEDPQCHRIQPAPAEDPEGSTDSDAEFWQSLMTPGTRKRAP